MSDDFVEVPSLLTVFAIVDRPGDAALWINCGRAKVNRDGSINVRMHVLPVDGRLHLRSAQSALGPIALPPPGPLTDADMQSYVNRQTAPEGAIWEEPDEPERKVG